MRDAIQLLRKEAFVQGTVAANETVSMRDVTKGQRLKVFHYVKLMMAANAVNTRDVRNMMQEEVFVRRMVAVDAVSTKDVIKAM